MGELSRVTGSRAASRRPHGLRQASRATQAEPRTQRTCSSACSPAIRRHLVDTHVQELLTCAHHFRLHLHSPNRWRSESLSSFPSESKISDWWCWSVVVAVDSNTTVTTSTSIEVGFSHLSTTPLQAGCSVYRVVTLLSVLPTLTVGERVTNGIPRCM